MNHQMQIWVLAVGRKEEVGEPHLVTVYQAEPGNWGLDFGPW